MTVTYKHPGIRHVFVLMLENRSFDHLFGLSGIHGIDVATSANTSPLPGGAPIAFAAGAPETMPTDPCHEFEAVVEQLCGPGAAFPNSHVYPPINNTGFAANYVKTFNTKTPARADVAKIMEGVNTAAQVPAIATLAQNYVLCDRWFSSLPGPTWPNRFFVHGASSAGLEHSPSGTDIALWETFQGFRYPKGSVFDALGAGNWRLYQDRTGPISGQIPQVAALKGIHAGDVNDLDDLAGDLAGAYPYAYTFIEPAYGDIVNGSYSGGSSQHPRDGLAAGDRLVARVYNAIRRSPLWASSLLIVTYDEHGGFYDHVAPPAATPPADNPPSGHNRSGFGFDRYGVRVPALVISPWAAKGVADHVMRDHASVAATLTSLFGMSPLTARDAAAHSLWSLLAGPMRTDADCPHAISGATLSAARAPPAIAAHVQDQSVAMSVKPIDPSGNLQGFLYVVRKAQAEAAATSSAHVAQSPGIAPPMTSMTHAQAEAYIQERVPALFGAKHSG